jgi:hypothetical protein
MKNNYYFLFGHDVIRMYETLGIDEVIIGISNGYDYATYNFNKEFENLSDPVDLLETYDGWDGWIEITEEEYNKLNSEILQNEKLQNSKE